MSESLMPFAPDPLDQPAPVWDDLDLRFGPEADAPWIEPVFPAVRDRVVIGQALRDANWADLQRLYLEDTDALRAFTRFRQLAGKPKKLAHLLRNHADESVTDPAEQADRDAFDDLLAFCAVLELALELRYVDRPHEDLLKHLRPLLGHPAVRAYYEVHYPLLLPQLLRQRLAGGRYYQAHQGPLQLAAFQRALELDTRLMRHEDVLLFLALADGFWIDGVSRHDLLALARKPDALLKALTRRKNRGLLDHAANGLRQFLFLTDGLHRLLGTLDEDPDFQSALWHHFGYWYGERRGTVVKSLEAMLAAVAEWPTEATTAAAVPSRRARELDAAIEALASDGYARVLARGFTSSREP